MGKNNIITPIRAKYLKSTPSFSIILIRVIRIVIVKLYKDSSVRGMQIPYDVLFWMVGQECMKKKSKNQKNTKKIRKRKVEKTYGLPSRFLLCSFVVFVIALLD